MCDVVWCSVIAAAFDRSYDKQEESLHWSFNAQSQTKMKTITCSSWKKDKKKDEFLITQWFAPQWVAVEMITATGTGHHIKTKEKKAKRS